MQDLSRILLLLDIRRLSGLTYSIHYQILVAFVKIRLASKEMIITFLMMNTECIVCM